MNEAMRSTMQTCYLCGRDSLRAVYEHSSGCSLVRCTQCGLMYFLHAPLHDYWSTGGSRSNLTVYTALEVQRSERQKFYRYLDWLRAELPPGKLLDYGCGIGTFIGCALEHGWQAHGIEVSPEIVGYAQQERKLPVWLPQEWPAQTYDAITLWDALEHLEDPRKTLQELVRHLKIGGVLMLETPDADFALRRVSLHVSRLSRGVLNLARFFFYPDHRYYFSASTIALLLKQVGLELRWIRRGTTPIPKVVEKLRCVHRAGWVTRTLAKLALRSTIVLGGNKLIVCARLSSRPKKLKIQTP